MFDLASISSDPSTAKPRTVIYGGSGLGKTTFGIHAPNPVFVVLEDGLARLSVPHFPQAKTFDDVMTALATLYTSDHPHETLVVDSLDWLEPLIWQAACILHGKASIEDFGFGKGYVEALSFWRQFLDGVTALRNDRNMHIVLLAHSQIVRIEDPLSPAYDSHTLKLHKRAAALVEEFADIIGFACLKTMTKADAAPTFADKNNKRTVAITTGERQLHLSPSPAFTAKNRYNLPAILPLEWAAFQACLDAPA